MGWTGLRIPSFLGGCYLFLVRTFQGRFWCLPNEPFPERFEKGDQGRLQGEHFLLRIHLGDCVCVPNVQRKNPPFSVKKMNPSVISIKTWLGATASPKLQKTSKKKLSLTKVYEKCLVSDCQGFAVFGLTLSAFLSLLRGQATTTHPATGKKILSKRLFLEIQRKQNDRWIWSTSNLKTNSPLCPKWLFSSSCACCCKNSAASITSAGGLR